MFSYTFFPVDVFFPSIIFCCITRKDNLEKDMQKKFAFISFKKATNNWETSR